MSEPATEPKLLDRVRQTIRTRHMNYTHVMNRGPLGVKSPVDP